MPHSYHTRWVVTDRPQKGPVEPYSDPKGDSPIVGLASNCTFRTPKITSPLRVFDERITAP